MESGKIKKDDLSLLFDRLADSYAVIGPTIKNDVIVLSEIGYSDLPAGYRDRQRRGKYELEHERSADVFSFSNGPDSLKRFLHPPSKKVYTYKKSVKGISINPVEDGYKPMAFIGIRACDLTALKLYDRIFTLGPVKDQDYSVRRSISIIVAVTCINPCDNCFCSSMGTGPEITTGSDITVIELSGSFILKSGTRRGHEILKAMPMSDVTDDDKAEAHSRLEHCREMISKKIRADELPSLMYRNLEHPRWSDIASRDLECGNCTQVCPTCFCNSSYDLTMLSGYVQKPPELTGIRMRQWDSCFSRNFARVHGGNFRPSRRARYRHWMAHKLAYTMDQFGLPGCVGCGRCITWCPAGIDITEELEALQRVR